MNSGKTNKLPESLRPLLWGLKWDKLNLEDDKEDIIINVVNGGRMADWKWLRSVYGKETVQRVLQGRLLSEFYPESRNLAKIFFGVNSFRYAR
jgi:hypothetical protein